MLARTDIRRLTRQEFERMVELGFFADEHTELLFGELATMKISPARADVITVLTEAVVLGVRDHASVRPLCPFAISDHSEPLPDLAVVVHDRYWHAHPSSAFWVIEVADETVYEKDRTVKAALYAEARIPEYWIANVTECFVEIYSQPASGSYEGHARHGLGETIAPVAFPDVRISITDLFK